MAQENLEYGGGRGSPLFRTEWYGSSSLQELPKLELSPFVRGWLAREARKTVPNTRDHPPLLAGDQLAIGGDHWFVAAVNQPMLYTQAPLAGGALDVLPSAFGDERPVAIINPTREPTGRHYLIVGTWKPGKRGKEHPAFQIVPENGQVRNFLRPGLQVSPAQALADRLAGVPPDSAVLPVAALRAAAKEWVRCRNVFASAGLFPAILVRLAGFRPGSVESTAAVAAAGGAGLYAIVLGGLMVQLKQAARAYQNDPAIQTVATLRFSS